MSLINPDLRRRAKYFHLRRKFHINWPELPGVRILHASKVHKESLNHTENNKADSRV